MNIRVKRVDRGTVYERTVAIDLDTLQGKHEELMATIDMFLADRRVMRHGKTERDRGRGKFATRMSRRAEHNGWMAKAQGNLAHVPHPFYAGRPVRRKRKAA